MSRAVAVCPAVLALVALVGGGRAADDPLPARLRDLPKGWVRVSSFTVPGAEIPALGRRLGVPIETVSNTVLTVDGQRLQVNTLSCATEADAVQVQTSVVKRHGGLRVACSRDGTAITEFVTPDSRLIERAYRDLGYPPPKTTYDVTFHAAPIVTCDFMKWNAMYNAFLASKQPEAGVRVLARDFTFGNRVWVRGRGLGREASVFEFDPKPSDTKPEAGGDLTSYTFADLPTKYGVPQVAFKAVVTCEAFAVTPTTRPAGPELLAASEFWPIADAEVVALAKRITGDRTDPADKVAALLAWFVPGKNVRYDGQVMGSRYGVKTVLKQGYGRCWDFADVFVTLARASGVPCRQVYGWLHGESGHVWAEVLVDGQGWRQIDPTSGAGCDDRYVPLVASETGAMPFVYTSAVRVEPRKSPR